jgi:hypothetical protein
MNSLTETSISDWTIEDRGQTPGQDRFIIRHKGEFVTTHVSLDGCKKFIGRRLAD